MSKEFLINQKGHHVPLSSIRETDLIRHEFVINAIEKAKEQRESLKAFKASQMAEMDAFVQLLAQEYEVPLGGKKGNVTLRSFDHKQRVVMQIQESIELGPELLIAKELIDECLNEWSQGANENLNVVIDQTFATDKKGKVSVQRVLGLRRLTINDDTGKWHQAMQIIADAIQVVDSSRFIRFYTTVGEHEHAISLDIAKL